MARPQGRRLTIVKDTVRRFHHLPDRTKDSAVGEIKMTTALNEQVGGEHYKNMPIQRIEFCQRNRLGACESEAIGYIVRHRAKNGKEDIEKAIHLLRILIEIEYGDDNR